jgi:hypothetical protein
MARDGITEADLADLMRRCQDAAAALIRGDVGSYLGLFVHGLLPAGSPSIEK